MSNRILSYRGLIEDGGQDTILLSTKKGEMGYRIIKFQLMPNQPGVDNMAFVVKIYKTAPASIDGVVDFSDNRLLGAGYYESEPSSYSDESTVIFDREIINQDIYVTCKESHQPGSEIVNYYIELEAIKLSEHDAMVATITNIRNG